MNVVVKIGRKIMYLLFCNELQLELVFILFLILCL